MAALSKFTKEQKEILSNNVYIQSVSETTIRYTSEFKEHFWEMYTKENLLPRAILRKMGIDPHILGKGRVRSIAKNLKLALDKYEGVEGFKSTQQRRLPKRKEIPITDLEVTRLRAEVEYLRQERDFLKKIISAGKGAKK